MKKLIIVILITVVAILAIIALKYLPGMSGIIWNVSQGGVWLLPLVVFSSILDSVHPCSFSILLITIAFLFGMNLTRGRILAVGGVYIAGIFVAYLAIGLGLLKVLHLFNTPHFMGKLGAALLIVFGLLNIINHFFPRFPIKLKIPASAHASMGKLIAVASIPAAFVLGLLVGICQFPCMGGPYLMVIGLLRDQVTYMSGFGHLLLYNFILIIPLVVVMVIAANKVLLDRVQVWRKNSFSKAHLWAGMAMIIIGILIFFT